MCELSPIANVADGPRPKPANVLLRNEIERQRWERKTCDSYPWVIEAKFERNETVKRKRGKLRF